MTSNSDNLRGITLMVLAAGVLLLNDAVTKLLAERYAISQVLALRQVAAMLPILAYLHFVSGWRALVSRDPGGQFVRGIFFVATVWLMVWSLSLLPLPTVTAIVFASPLFIAALSGPMLGERVSGKRWAATMVGFLGVLVIVRPGTAAFDWALLIAVAAAMVNGMRDILTRRLSGTDSSIAILFWSSMLVLVTSVPLPLLGGWTAVPMTDAAVFLLAGLLNTGAHFLVIEALRNGQAAVVSPFRYSALVWSVIIGFLVWGDLPSWWTLIGAVIMVASGIYMMRQRN